MSDTIKKWEEMQEEKKYIISDQGGEYYVPEKGGEAIPYRQKAQWVFIMDYTDGKAYRYDVSDLADDSEVIEAFLHGAGHKLSNCEWMVTKHKDFINGN